MAWARPSAHDNDYEEEDEEVSRKQDQQYSNWHGPKDGVYRPIGQATAALPAGCYSVNQPYPGEPWQMVPTTFNADTVLNLAGTPTQFLLGQLATFWERMDKFKSCGLLHKRGMLMYGTPGCGKTSIIKSVADAHIARDGLVVIVDNVYLIERALAALRQIEPNRPVLTVLEDIETFAMGDAKPKLLALLDGESQIEHVAHLATTNVPDDLDDTLTKRPGRFDVVVQLLPPTREAREQYLKHLLNGGLSDVELKSLVEQSTGLSLAHLRELVVATYCLGADQQETLARLLGNAKRKRFTSEEGLGFNVRFHEKSEG